MHPPVQAPATPAKPPPHASLARQSQLALHRVVADNSPKLADFVQQEAGATDAAAAVPRCNRRELGAAALKAELVTKDDLASAHPKADPDAEALSMPHSQGFGTHSGSVKVEGVAEQEAEVVQVKQEGGLPVEQQAGEGEAVNAAGANSAAPAAPGTPFLAADPFTADGKAALQQAIQQQPVVWLNALLDVSPPDAGRERMWAAREKLHDLVAHQLYRDPDTPPQQELVDAAHSIAACAPQRLVADAALWECMPASAHSALQVISLRGVLRSPEIPATFVGMLEIVIDTQEYKGFKLPPDDTWPVHGPNVGVTLTQFRASQMQMDWILRMARQRAARGLSFQTHDWDKLFDESSLTKMQQTWKVRDLVSRHIAQAPHLIAFSFAGYLQPPSAMNMGVLGT